MPKEVVDRLSYIVKALASESVFDVWYGYDDDPCWGQIENDLRWLLAEVLSLREQCQKR